MSSFTRTENTEGYDQILKHLAATWLHLWAGLVLVAVENLIVGVFLTFLNLIVDLGSTFELVLGLIVRMIEELAAETAPYLLLQVHGGNMLQSI